MKQAIHQSGYALLVFILLLIGSVSFPLISYVKALNDSNKNGVATAKIADLTQVKKNLLTYAALVPELNSTDSSNVPYADDRVPGPGYLPCPDTDGDGASNAPCGAGVNWVVGRVPVRITSRNYSFINNVKGAHEELIWYAVDARYVIQNSDYNNPPIQRYAPLNPGNPGASNHVLTLNGENDFVAILFYANAPLVGQSRTSNSISDYLEGENADGDADFVSQASTSNFNDLVIGIRHSEWVSEMRKRVQPQVASLCNPLNLDPDAPHWFNSCHNDDGGGGTICPDDGDTATLSNPVGSDWRNDSVANCP